MSIQSKSFLILFCIAVVGVYLSIWLATPSGAPINPTNNGYKTTIYSFPAQPPKVMPVETMPAVDTSAWKTYTDKHYGLSFKYPAGWKVLPKTAKYGFDILQVDPGTKFYNIKIYINPKQYFGMDSLPMTADTIGGQPAQNVRNLLYGVQTGGYYYTFDIGFSLSLNPNFAALVHSATFQ